LRQRPAVVVLERPAERRDGGELLMSGCVCHGSAACLDLNMLGQWLLLKEEAMLSRFFFSCCPPFTAHQIFSL
jgi:hypothetical protein